MAVDCTRGAAGGGGIPFGVPGPQLVSIAGGAPEARCQLWIGFELQQMPEAHEFDHEGLERRLERWAPGALWWAPEALLVEWDLSSS